MSDAQDRLNTFAERMDAVAQRARNSKARTTALDAARKRAQEMGSRAALAVVFEALRADGRPTFDATYLAVAQVIGMMGDCSRDHVGAVFVRDDVPLAWGYNGVEPGARGCLAGACPRAGTNVPHGAPYDDCISQHAERNAIGFAANHGIRLADSALYVSREPCGECYKSIAAVRTVRVVWPGQLTSPPAA